MQKRYAPWSKLESDRRWVNILDEHTPFFLGGYDRGGFPVGSPSQRDLFLAKPPIHSRALFLNGGSAWVDFGDSAQVINGTTYTLEFWLFPMYCEKWARVFAQGSTANASQQVELIFYEGRVLSLFEGSAAPLSPKVTSKPLRLGEWQHIAIVRNGSSYALYVNGQLAEDTNPSATVSSSGPTGIGAYNTGVSDQGNFGICDFRVWSVARTQTQIQDNFKKAIDPATSGLVAYWYFDDGGTTIDDKTSGARDGTILGPARTTTTYGYFWYPN